MAIDFDAELTARRAVVAQLHGFTSFCGHCGQTMQACACGTTPAKDETTKDERRTIDPPSFDPPTMPPPDEPPPSGWRDRPGLL